MEVPSFISIELFLIGKKVTVNVKYVDGLLEYYVKNAKTGSYTPEFDERYRTIAEEINALKEAQKTARNEKRMADSYEQRIQDIDHYLSTSTCQIPEFDNDLVRRLISTIKVESSEKLLIQFQSGIVMEQEIRYE